MTIRCALYTTSIVWLYMTFLPSSATAPLALVDPEVLYDFTQVHNDFVRTYFGCPKEINTVSQETCNLNAGILDLRQYDKARRLAAKFYKFSDDTKRD